MLFAAKSDRFYQIFKIRPDGHDFARLVHVNGDCREPNLCAATGQVVFTVREDQHLHIYVTDLEGTYLKRLTNNIADEHHPVWSPDGSRIAFETDRWGKSEIGMLNVKSGEILRLTHNQTMNRFPVWSPDGRKLAYLSHCQGKSNIYMFDNMQDSPSHPASRRLTRDAFSDVTPAWLPDSRHLIFGTRNHAGRFLSLIDINTLEEKRLETETADYNFPAWCPSADIPDNPADAQLQEGDPVYHLAALKNYSQGLSLIVFIDLLRSSHIILPVKLPDHICDLVWCRQLRPWEKDQETTTPPDLNSAEPALP